MAEAEKINKNKAVTAADWTQNKGSKKLSFFFFFYPNLGQSELNFRQEEEDAAPFAVNTN